MRELLGHRRHQNSTPSDPNPANALETRPPDARPAAQPSWRQSLVTSSSLPSNVTRAHPIPTRKCEFSVVLNFPVFICIPQLLSGQGTALNIVTNSHGHPHSRSGRPRRVSLHFPLPCSSPLYRFHIRVSRPAGPLISLHGPAVEVVILDERRGDLHAPDTRPLDRSVLLRGSV